MAKSKRYDDDDFDDEDDRPKRRRSDDDYDDEDDPAPRKRRRDDDDYPKPKARKKKTSKKLNVIGLVGMILGIISIVLGVPFCCCLQIFSTPISIGFGTGGLVCGLIGNKKAYGKGFAMTGIITGFFGILFGITIIILTIFNVNVKQYRL